MLKVRVLEESGYRPALLGLSLSFYDHAEDLDTWFDEEKFDRAVKRATALAGKGGGHDKFLRSINLQLFIQAPRSFWSEFHTYGIGVTKNSSSTMHTLSKRPVTADDFSSGTSEGSIAAFNLCLKEYHDTNSPWCKDVTRLKDNLPEGWLQERQVSTNYAAVLGMLRQRETHRLRYWEEFCSGVVGLVEHPELLKGEVHAFFNCRESMF